MKSVITALLILAIIVTGSIICTNKLDALSENLILRNKYIMDLVTDDSYDLAEEKISELNKFLNKKKLLLASVIDHTEIDKIELNIAQTKAYIKEHKKEDSLSYINALDTIFKHIPKNYRIKIENIL